MFQRCGINYRDISLAINMKGFEVHPCMLAALSLALYCKQTYHIISLPNLLLYILLDTNAQQRVFCVEFNAGTTKFTGAIYV